MLFGHVPDLVHDAARAVPLAAVPAHTFMKVLSSMLAQYASPAWNRHGWGGAAVRQTGGQLDFAKPPPMLIHTGFPKVQRINIKISSNDSPMGHA